MMTFPTAYHADSDADDEYERSVLTSPILPNDFESSPTDSEPPSAEHTPTTFGGHMDVDRSSPRSIITEWTAEECTNFVSSLGLSQYREKFLENEIVGEALIALKHDELKEMGITSVGHRLTILKGVYDIKIKQDIPIDSDHYIPLSAEASVQDQTATQDDIARIIQSIKMRDERIVQAESELRRVTDEYRKLREELLPVFRMAKDKSQPLPFQPSASGYSPDYHNHNEAMTSPVTSQAPLEKGGGNTSRKFPTQKLFVGSTPKTNSPTHIPHSIPEGKPLSDTTNLDPSAAVTLASNHLAAQTISGNPPASSPNQINLPSPTSPSIYNNQQPLPPHIYSRPNGNPQALARLVYAQTTDDSYSSLAPTLTGLERDRSNPTPTPPGSNRQPRQPDEPPPTYSSAQKEAPSVDIVKKFRVSVDDPCYKVLPAALKKYNINAPWRQYSLYIVYGDQERCLGLDEKPLELFKQLNLEGRKPMFMLRRHATPTEGHSGPSATGGTGSAGFDPATGLSALRGHQSSIQLTQLPGGVL